MAVAISGEGPPAAAARRRWPRVALAALACAALAGLAAVAAAIVWLALTVPLRDGTAAEEPRPSLVLEAADGRPFAARGSFAGARVALADLPPHVVDAVLSIEDRRFRSHPGVDLRGLARAVATNVAAGGVEQGGSTITQQVARLLYLSREQSLARKLQEALIAVWLELRLTKDEILERYLNAAYFGGGATGIQGAARRYFGKPAPELSLSEAAMLAGLIQAPSVYAPTRDLGVARGRADVVLGAMVAAGRLDEAAAEAARAAPASLALDPEEAPGRRYYGDWVADEARRLLGPVAAEFRLATTLDLDLQAAAEETVEAWLAREGDDRGVSQAALVALSHDGAVLAMVGGRDYRESQFNRAAQARRQPGSLFKLFVFMEALNAGLAPDSPVVDEPVEIDGWAPRNINGRHLGRITLRRAFAESVNTVAVRLGDELGPERVIDLARSLGVASPLRPDPSLPLGTSPVTLLEITAAYAAVAAARPKVEPYGIREAAGGGQTFYARQPPLPFVGPLPYKRRETLDLLLAAVRAGTAGRAALARPAAGKTGTTQDNRDAWFVGFTADAVVGVWVGNDDNSPTRDVTGGGLPASIWHEFMKRADEIKGGVAGEAAPEGPPSQVQPRQRGAPG